jgi:hypothetical protein
MAREMADYVLGLMFGNPVHLNDLPAEDARIIEEWLQAERQGNTQQALRDRAWTVIEVTKLEHPDS